MGKVLTKNMPQIKVEEENESVSEQRRHPSVLEETDGYLSDSSSTSSDDEEEDEVDAETEEVESPGGISLHLPPNKYLCM